MNFRGRVCEPQIYFLVFVFFVTRGRRLCWNINESERSIQALEICLFIPSNRTVCKWPSERIQHLYPSKNCRTPLHSRTKKKSLLVIQLENKLNDLKPLFSRKKSLTFQKRSKKMFLYWRANLADQNKQQPLKINIRVTYHTVLSVWNKPLIDTCQHCSTSRANQALRSLANAGF